MRIACFNANMRVGQDGVTRCMYRLFDEVLRRGHEAIAITATLPDGNPPVPMYRVPSFAIPLQKTYRMALPGYASFRKVLGEFRPDVLHINSPCTLGFAAMNYGRRHGVPVVATYQTHFPTYARYYNVPRLEAMIWRLLRHLYNNVSLTLVPTRPIMEDLQEHGIRGLRYAPNGVDHTQFNPSFRSAAWRERINGGEKPIVLFVSRLVWEKDLRVLADAWRILRARRDDFTLVLVGDGHARAELEQQMPDARFLGYQSGRALSECYASADVFAFPSTTETFGLVTLEAMASGLAPVAARVGGAIEIIEEERSGLLAEPRSAAGFAACIERLLDDASLRARIARGALARAREYSWDTLLDRILASYSEVIGLSPSRRAVPAAVVPLPIHDPAAAGWDAIGATTADHVDGNQRDE
jgi:glycosyltransferase involved in cell wall biosynthesis